MSGCAARFPAIGPPRPAMPVQPQDDKAVDAVVWRTTMQRLVPPGDGGHRQQLTTIPAVGQIVIDNLEPAGAAR